MQVGDRTGVGIERDADGVDVAGWRFTGRAGELRQLSLALRRPGQVVVLRGPAGIGKTSLALAAVTAEAGDHAVARASAGASGSSLTALVPLLEALGVDTQLDHAAVVAAALRSLDGRRAPLMLVVDDAPRLDPASVTVLHHVVRHDALRTVLTVRDGEVLPDALDHLLDEGAATSMIVPPLELDDCTSVLRTALGAVDAVAVTRLHAASGGNPLILRELVAGTVAADGLVETPAGWSLTEPVPSSRLVDLVTRRFELLEPGQVELLELLAVAQPLPVGPLVEIEGAEANLLALEQQALVEVRPDGAALAHPVYDEVIRAALPPLRLDARRVRAASLLLGAGDPDAAFRATCLQVDAGHRVPGAELAAAARRAFGLLDHELAVRLAERAVDHGEEFWGHLVLGGACSALGDLDRAARSLRAAVEAASDDEQRALAGQRLGMHLAVRAERPAEALAVAEAILAELDDEAWVRFLAADVTKWRMMAGRSIGDALASPHAQDGALDVVAQLNDQMIRALVGVMGGDLEAADAAIDVALPIALEHPEVLPNASDLLRLSRFLSLTFAARIGEATALAEHQLELAARERADSLGMWSYALAMADLHCGRAVAAADRAAFAVAKLEWRDFTGLRPAARALSAVASAQLGKVGVAQAALDELAPEALLDTKVDLLDAQARAWIAVAARDREGAVELLAAAGARAIERDHPCLGALVSHDAVRLGRADLVVDDLVRASQGRSVPLVTLLADHALAAASRDRSGLEAVSLQLEQVGLLVAAADAAAQAARLHRRSGRSEAARRAERRAAALAAACDGPLGTADEPSVTLTPRELEVAVLACGRLRSREIAEQLDISVRTVDNHLASAYRKLGVVNRAELAAAMEESGWIR